MPADKRHISLDTAEHLADLRESANRLARTFAAYAVASRFDSTMFKRLTAAPA